MWKYEHPQRAISRVSNPILCEDLMPNRDFPFPTCGSSKVLFLRGSYFFQRVPVWIKSWNLWGTLNAMGSSGPKPRIISAVELAMKGIDFSLLRLQGPRTVDPSWTPARGSKHGTSWLSSTHQSSSPIFFSPFIKPQSVCWSFHILHPVMLGNLKLETFAIKKKWQFYTSWRTFQPFSISFPAVTWLQ